MTHFTIYYTEQKTESESFIRLAAADYTGKSCIRSEILREKHGKPYFSETDMPHFSLSHSGKFTICAVGPIPCGIDIQEHAFHGKPRDADYLIRLAERFFHPAEAERLKNASDVKQSFFDRWAAKESCGKCTGDGVTGFSSFNTLDPANIFPRRITKIPLAEGYSTFLCAAEDFDYTTKRI